MLFGIIVFKTSEKELLIYQIMQDYYQILCFGMQQVWILHNVNGAMIVNSVH